MSRAEIIQLYAQLQLDQGVLHAYLAAPDEVTQQQVLQQFALSQGVVCTAADLHAFVTLAQQLRAAPASLSRQSVKLEEMLMPNSGAMSATLSLNRLERGLLWLSGASPAILATCPESEQKKHAALGGAVLIPALLAIVTASFLLYTLNFNVYTIVSVALLWACIILLMDRALLATYRVSFSLWGKLAQLGLRLSIALLIAVTVAHPVVLLLFSERIDAAYNAGRIKTERANLALECDVQTPSSAVSALEAKVKDLRAQLLQQPSVDPLNCQGAAANATDTPGLALLLQKLSELQSQQTLADQDVARYTANADAEKQGQGGSGLTGVRGCNKGTQCKKWLLQASERKDDSIRLGKEIVALNAQIDQLQQKNALQLLEDQHASKHQCMQEHEALQTYRVKQHELDQSALAAASKQLQQLQERCSTQAAQIAQLKPDILTQTELLTQLIFTAQGISWHNLGVFLVFMLLFLAIDMLAVVLKMSRTGLYEAKVELAESANQFLSFMAQRHQTLQQFSAFTEAEQRTIDTLHQPILQKELQQNLSKLVAAYTKHDDAKIDRLWQY